MRCPASKIDKHASFLKVSPQMRATGAQRSREISVYNLISFFRLGRLNAKKNSVIARYSRDYPRDRAQTTMRHTKDSDKRRNFQQVRLLFFSIQSRRVMASNWGSTNKSRITFHLRESRSIKKLEIRIRYVECRRIPADEWNAKFMRRPHV